MTVIDPDGAGHHTDAKKHRYLFKGVQMFSLRYIPDQRKQGQKLERYPTHGYTFVPEQILIRGIKVSVIKIQACDGVKD